MKFNSYNMLAKANIKRGKKSNTIFVLLIISVILLTLVLAFSTTLSSILDKYVNNELARRFEIMSWGTDFKKINQQTLNEIAQLKHVVNIDTCDNLSGLQIFTINNISDDNNKNHNNMLPYSNKKSNIRLWSLYEHQNINVVLGENLENSPIFSCIVPDEINFDSDYNTSETIGGTQKGSDYIGKILTIKPKDVHLSYYRNISLGNDLFAGSWRNLPSIEYKIKVVGVYSTSDIPYGNPNSIYVSYKTGKEILGQAIIAAVGKEEYEKELEEAKKHPGLNNHMIVVDKSENVSQVQNQLNEMKVNYGIEAVFTDFYNETTFAAMFTGAANFLIGSMLLLTIINIFLSVLNNIMERKSEIGLLKAVGYTNRQVFFTMYLEQLKIGLRAFAIGFTVSGITVLIMNYINATGPFVQRKYIVDLTTFVTLGSVALLLVVLVPLICQLIALKRLANITPKQAMSQR